MATNIEEVLEYYDPNEAFERVIMRRIDKKKEEERNWYRRWHEIEIEKECPSRERKDYDNDYN